jgi:hypothetical protein
VPAAIHPEHAVDDVSAQFTPLGLEETTPDPPPAFKTEIFAAGSKRAVTFTEVATFSRHEAVPEQAPLQPTKALPGAGTAVRVIAVLRVKTPTHMAPQSTPEMLEDTVPIPPPDFSMVRTNPFTMSITAPPVVSEMLSVSD